jgi:UDP-2,3-diacylglucosamine hydrolase
MLLFISDAHLGNGRTEEQAERRRLLFDCLDHYTPHLEKLIIIGDLFDFWFEWRYVI